MRLMTIRLVCTIGMKDLGFRELIVFYNSTELTWNIDWTLNLSISLEAWNLCFGFSFYFHFSLSPYPSYFSLCETWTTQWIFINHSSGWLTLFSAYLSTLHLPIQLWIFHQFHRILSDVGLDDSRWRMKIAKEWVRLKTRRNRNWDLNIFHKKYIINYSYEKSFLFKYRTFD